MATKSRSRQVRRALRFADDVLFLSTGRRWRPVVRRGINVFGEELARKAANLFSGPDEPDLPLHSPYTTLGIYPESMDVVVKAAFRALAREYHPDTGTNPDPAKFQAATEAYTAIMAERGKGQEDGGKAQ